MHAAKVGDVGWVRVSGAKPAACSQCMGGWVGGGGLCVQGLSAACSQFMDGWVGGWAGGRAGKWEGGWVGGSYLCRVCLLRAPKVEGGWRACVWRGCNKCCMRPRCVRVRTCLVTLEGKRVAQSVLCTPTTLTCAPLPPPHQLRKEESVLDFRLPAVQLHNTVRGFAGWPGTSAMLTVMDDTSGGACLLLPATACYCLVYG